MKRLFNFKYPKIFGLIIAIILAYIIFTNPLVDNFVLGLDKLEYLGVFIAGMLFSFGFTAPFSAGFFIVLNPSNIWLAGVIGGLGAMISDLLIFKFIRFSFRDEFNNLTKEKASKRLKSKINKITGNKIRIYLMYIFAGFLIASPLPDEAGIIMFAGLTKIKTKFLALIGFLLNTLGILILMWI